MTFSQPDPGSRPGPYDARGPQDHVPGRPGPGPMGAAGGPSPASGGFRGLPFPHYSTRTRNGTQVAVGGCCLPLPLGCLMTTLAVGGAAVARFVRSR